MPWISDGNPMTWFTPTGTYGPSTAAGTSGNIYTTLDPFLQPGQAEYYYPNHQSARMLWYHDHAHDITRLNAYAGLASAYIIRDAFEVSLCAQGLPTFIEIDFDAGRPRDADRHPGQDLRRSQTSPPRPDLAGPDGRGQPVVSVRLRSARWPLEPPLGLLPDPSVVPEMFGDTMLANGTVYPGRHRGARRYRLRILNACQARFLNLQLYVDDGSPDGITLDAALRPHQSSRPRLPGDRHRGRLPAPAGQRAASNAAVRSRARRSRRA